jgi:putative resolvase
MRTYNIAEVAKMLHKSVRTLQTWDRKNLLHANRTPTNRRYYTQETIENYLGIVPKPEDRKIIAYCRVSSAAQKPDLKNQRKALEDFCTARGFGNVEFVSEIGGGLNFKRKQFNKVMDAVINGLVSHIVVAHKDRLCRFGFEWFLRMAKERGCEIVVLNSEQLSPEQEMVTDLMTIIHCFSSRLYGLRNYRKTLKEALKKK